MASKRKAKKEIVLLMKELGSEIIARMEVLGYDPAESVALLNSMFDQMDDFINRVNHCETDDCKSTKANFKELAKDMEACAQDIADRLNKMSTAKKA